MIATLVKEVLTKNMGKTIKVFSEHSGETHKGYLQKHGRSWQLKITVDKKIQRLFFPTCIVGVVQQNPLIIRLKNKRT